MTHTHLRIRSTFWSFCTCIVVASVSSFGATSAAAQSGSLPSAVSATATMIGRVFADSNQGPLADAEVAILDLNLKTRSNSEGRFGVRGIPIGTHRLEIRRVGYEPFLTVLTLKKAEDFEMDIVLQKNGQILQTVLVAGSNQERRLKLFNENRMFGSGTFVSRDRLTKFIDFPLATALVGKVPAVVGSTKATLGGTGKRVAMSNRGTDCFLQVVVNEMTLYSGYDGEPVFDLASIQTQDVLAVEHYTAAQTPARYRQTSGTSKGAVCGTLVLWTR